MAAPTRVVRDIRDEKTGMHFEVEGSNIQKAIREKIQQSLEPQIKELLGKLDPILEDKKKVATCLGAFARMINPDELSSDVGEIYVMSSKLDRLTQEVTDLTRIGQNLFSDDWYVLDLTLLGRFGL